MDEELKDHHTKIVFMIATYWPNKTNYHYITQELSNVNFSPKQLTHYQKLVKTFYK